MPEDRMYVGEVLPRSAQTPDDDSLDPDALRARAARYRSLAETLVDLRVMAVVQACAHELEMKAMSVRADA